MATFRSKNLPSIVYWLDEKLYLNITNRCTNNCYFCIRKFKKTLAGFNLQLDKPPSIAEILRALQRTLDKKSWTELVFCGYGEPTTRLDTLLEVAAWIKENTSHPIRADTNGHGFLLYPKRDIVKELKNAGITRLSISLNASDEATYNEVCHPIFENAFEKVLEFTQRARDEGFEVEVTAVTIPEVKISKIEKVAAELKVALRIRHYQPCIW